MHDDSEHRPTSGMDGPADIDVGADPDLAKLIDLVERIGEPTEQPA